MPQNMLVIIRLVMTDGTQLSIEHGNNWIGKGEIITSISGFWDFVLGNTNGK